MLSWFILLMKAWDHFLLSYDIVWIYLKTLSHFTSSYLSYMLFLCILFLNQVSRYRRCYPRSFSVIISTHCKWHCFWSYYNIIILILTHLWLDIILLPILLNIVEFRDRFFSHFLLLFNIGLVIVIKGRCNAVLNVMTLHQWILNSHLSSNLSFSW